MAEEIKFTEEELAQLKAYQDEFNNSILQFGQLSIEEIDLAIAQKRLAEVRSRLEAEHTALNDRQKILAAQLNNKYGQGVLDPKTGIFTPAPKQEATA